jgi:hypothetical protein
MENEKKSKWMIVVYLTAYLVLIATALSYSQTPDTLRTMDRTDKTYIEEHTTVYDTIKGDTSSDLKNDAYTNTTPTYTVPQEEPGLKEPPPLHRGEFGIRYMPLFTSLDLYTNNGNSATGVVTMQHGAGAMIGFNFSKNVGLQLEGNYYNASQTIRNQATGQTYDVDLGYLNFPVLLVLNTDKRRAINANVHGGPQFGLNVSSNVKTTGSGDYQAVSATIATGNNDIGVAYGAGLEIALNKAHTLRLDLGYRGFYGLVDLGASETNHGDNATTYNIFVKGSRQANGAYLGLRIGF